jgi:transcriptional regulator with XRE-family HTH domain
MARGGPDTVVAVNGPAQTVGANLRRLRLARGLSLVELGRLSGLAKGTLTQLEAGRANPTIETLQALAGALAAGLTDLVADPPVVAAEVVRAGTGAVTPGRILEGRLINRSHLGSMIVELFELRLTPGSVHHAQSHATGVVEQLFVLDGTVRVGPEGHEVEIGPRDWTRFPADRPHSYAAVDGEARTLMWQLLPTLPSPAASISSRPGGLTTVEELVPRGPGVVPLPRVDGGRSSLGGGTPSGSAAPPVGDGPRTLPQPPVRGRRPPSRTVPGPTPGRPKPPGPGR